MAPPVGLPHAQLAAEGWASPWGELFSIEVGAATLLPCHPQTIAHRWCTRRPLHCGTSVPLCPLWVKPSDQSRQQLRPMSALPLIAPDFPQGMAAEWQTPALRDTNRRDGADHEDWPRLRCDTHPRRLLKLRAVMRTAWALVARRRIIAWSSRKTIHMTWRWP